LVDPAVRRFHPNSTLRCRERHPSFSAGSSAMATLLDARTTGVGTGSDRGAANPGQVVLSLPRSGGPPVSGGHGDRNAMTPVGVPPAVVPTPVSTVPPETPRRSSTGRAGRAWASRTHWWHRVPGPSDRRPGTRTSYAADGGGPNERASDAVPEDLPRGRIDGEHARIRLGGDVTGASRTAPRGGAQVPDAGRPVMTDPSSAGLR